MNIQRSLGQNSGLGSPIIINGRPVSVQEYLSYKNKADEGEIELKYVSPSNFITKPATYSKPKQKEEIVSSKISFPENSEVEYVVSNGNLEFLGPVNYSFSSEA